VLPAHAGKSGRRRSRCLEPRPFISSKPFAEVLESWTEKGELGNLIQRPATRCLLTSLHDHQRDRSHQEKRKPGHGYSPGKCDQETNERLWFLAAKESSARYKFQEKSSERNRVSKMITPRRRMTLGWVPASTSTRVRQFEIEGRDLRTYGIGGTPGI